MFRFLHRELTERDQWRSPKACVPITVVPKIRWDPQYDDSEDTNGSTVSVSKVLRQRTASASSVTREVVGRTTSTFWHP